MKCGSQACSSLAEESLGRGKREQGQRPQDRWVVGVLTKSQEASVAAVEVGWGWEWVLNEEFRELDSIRHCKIR